MALTELLKKYELTEDSINKEVSDDHLESISRSCCKEWKSLPSHLELAPIVADDIDKDQIEEKAKRHQFFRKWKAMKGSDATYKQLISALLNIDCRQDAECVCKLGKTLIPTQPRPFGSGGTTQTPKSSAGGTAVRCPNSRCKWKGPGTLEEHLAICKFTAIPCPLQCKDSNNDTKKILKKGMDNHVENDCPNREYECEYCQAKGTYAKITQVHAETCKKKVVRCEKCDKSLQRKGMKKHKETSCKEEEVQCKYQKFGCDKTFKRKDLPKHEDDDVKSHLHMAVTRIEEAIDVLEDQSMVIEQKMEEQAITVLKNDEPLTFKVPDTKEVYTIPSFYTGPNGYNMTISVHPTTGSGESLSVLLKFLEGKHDEHLKQPFVGEIIVTLLNQLSDNNHLKRTITIKNGDTEKNPCYSESILRSELAHDPVQNTQYLKDDTLYFRVEVKVDEHKPWLECTAIQLPS